MNLTWKLSLLVAFIALAVVAGVGMVATDFTSYLGDDPNTCNNCHVMDGVYTYLCSSSHSFIIDSSSPWMCT